MDPEYKLFRYLAKHVDDEAARNPNHSSHGRLMSSLSFSIVSAFNQGTSLKTMFTNWSNHVVNLWNRGQATMETMQFIHKMQDDIANEVYMSWHDEWEYGYPTAYGCPPHSFVDTGFLWSFCKKCNRTGSYNRETGEYEIA